MGRNSSPPLVPLRPCSLCRFFVLTGADPDSLDAYARCDAPGFEREIFPGGEVLRCHSFEFRHLLAERENPSARSGMGIGALITTDAKSQNETNRDEFRP